MSRFSLTVAATTLFSPQLAFAADINTVIDDLTDIVGLIIPLLLSAAVAVFFWGLVKFIAHADDEKMLEDGKQMVVWGMIAIFIMVALWSIVGFIQRELDLDLATTPENLPVLPLNLP